MGGGEGEEVDGGKGKGRYLKGRCLIEALRLYIQRRIF